MTTDNLTIEFTVDQSPEAVFDAVANVRGWWLGDIDGVTDRPGGEFTYRYENVHRSTQRITEFVPGRRIAWHVTDAFLSFLEDTTEWVGTDIVFDIDRVGDKTRLRFTHIGLTPAVECFDACSPAWQSYIGGSLKNLVEGGARTDAAAILRKYLGCVADHDLDPLNFLISDDAVASTSGGAFGKAEWILALRRLLPVMVRYDIREIFLGEESAATTACAVYDFVTDTEAGAVPCMEWITVADGRITTIELIFEKAKWSFVAAALEERAALAD